MKINWGTGVVLAFVAFISFILYFVIRMNSEDRANHDLVTEEYYKQELGYQQEIDDEISANKLANKLKVEQTDEGLVIDFPIDQEPKKISGMVILYRPSNKKLDFNIPIDISSSRLVIPSKKMLEGRWDIKIAWSYATVNYLYKESITY